jgi:hypothetical protein
MGEHGGKWNGMVLGHMVAMIEHRKQAKGVVVLIV